MQIKTDKETNEARELFVPHFDTHVHGRRGQMMNTVVPIAAQRMCGGCFEPNTNPHLETHDHVLAYIAHADCLAHKQWAGSIYLTPHTDPKEVERAWRAGLIAHVKRYPPHGTTHSDEGVTPEMMLDQSSNTGKLLSFMAEAGIPLKSHGEVTHWQGKEISPEKRERVYYLEIQPRIRDTYPALRQIGAHISSKAAVEHFREFGNADTYVCEMTPHHLAFDDTVRYDGGFLLPDHHCLPVIKDEEHREALWDLLSEKPPYVMAGSDMAAHDVRNKYAQRAFGGIFTYHCSLELYVEMLERLGLLGYAEQFLYGNAKHFFGKLVPENPSPVHLVKETWAVDSRVAYEDGEMTPFGYDDDPFKRYEFHWKVVA